MVGRAAKGEAVAHLRTMFRMSERRACSLIAADRSSVRYRSCRPPDAELRGQLRDLADARRRFGYRRLFILLRQQGEASGINRICRLHREEGLTVRRCRARRRAVGTRAPILPLGPYMSQPGGDTPPRELIVDDARLVERAKTV
jgi:putative transposase